MNSNQANELNQPKIVKTIFILDKNRRYSFDVNQNIKIYLLKKMIDAAANLNRAHLRIFHEGKEYTSYDESSLDILFPDLNIIIFNLLKKVIFILSLSSAYISKSPFSEKFSLTFLNISLTNFSPDCK